MGEESPPTETEVSHQWPQYVAAISSVLLAVSTGLHFGWPSPAVPKILTNDLQFVVSVDEASYVVMLSPLGYLLGCPISAMLLDKIGRKYSILILAGPQIIAWILIANSTGINMLYIARFICGIAEGGAITTVPVYIGEITESNVRGSLGMSYSTSAILGILLIDSYGSHYPLRTSAYVSISVPLFFIFIFMWMPESPYFLIMKNRTQKARTSLRRLRMMNNVEEELIMLTNAVERQIAEPNTIKDIFRLKSNLKAFFIVIGLRSLQQFTGGAAITSYNQVIFKKARTNVSFIYSSITFNTVFLIMTVCSSVVVDRIGRRPMLMISTAGTGICLFIMGVYFTLQHYNYDLSSFYWVPLTSMIFYTISRGMGVTPIPTVIMGELFSASIKAKAVGLVNIYLALCMSISYKLFQWLGSSIAMEAPFFIYVFFCCIGFIFLYYCVPETKGKSLEEIQQKLKGHSTTTVI